MQKQTIADGAEPFDFGAGKRGILFLHGWSSTPRELRFLAEKVAQQGFRCRGILFPGHGRDEKALAAVDWEEMLAAAEQALEELLEESEEISLVGFSFGGALTLELARIHALQSIVLLAPFVQVSGNSLSRGLNRILLKMLPNFSPSLSKAPEGPIFDQVEREAHICSSRIPISSAKTVLEGAKFCTRNLGEIQTPTLIIHSTRDRTSDFAGSETLLRELGCSKKELVALERSNHVVTLDYDRDEVERRVVGWFENHSLSDE